MEPDWIIETPPTEAETRVERTVGKDADRLSRLATKYTRDIRQKFDSLCACLRCAGLRGGQENELVDETRSVQALVGKFADAISLHCSRIRRQADEVAEKQRALEVAATENQRDALAQQERAHKAAMRKLVSKHKAEKQRLGAAAYRRIKGVQR